MWCITVRGFVVRALHRHDRCVYIRTDVPEGFVIHIYNKNCIGHQASDTVPKKHDKQGLFWYNECITNIRTKLFSADHGDSIYP